MAIKEACFNDYDIQTSNDNAPLDDPWFWPNDEQPFVIEPDELNPFWR